MAYTFDALGVVTSANDPASHLAFDFDGLNRLTRATQSGVTNLADFTLTYTYDGTDNVMFVTDNWGVQVASAYDAQNRLTQRVWQGGGVPGASLHFYYNAAGNRTNIMRYADAAGTQIVGQSHYVFNTLGAITDIFHANGAGVPLAEYHYQRNAAQEITQRVLGSQTADYRYDLTGQLTNALHSDDQPNEGYHYDANGNRIGSGYVVANNNQIVADGTNTYSYDLEGSLVQRSNTATHFTTTYAYDHRNRLVSTVDKDAGGTMVQTVELTYDAFDRRIAKSVNSSAVRFLLNQISTWADADGAGNITARYLPGQQIDELVARYHTGESISWYLTDNLGSVGHVVASNGLVINHITYDSFGRVLSQSAPELGDRFSFTGREWDEETGLFFYRARYYSPALGRFTSQDPIGFLGSDWNLYRYAANNPILKVDPSGRSFSEYVQSLRISVSTYVSSLEVVQLRILACGLGLASEYYLGWLTQKVRDSLPESLKPSATVYASVDAANCIFLGITFSFFGGWGGRIAAIPLITAGIILGWDEIMYHFR